MHPEIRSSVRTAKILSAAARLFAKQGYHGTTTREIAQLASVSENTLFRNFESKEKLFWAALLRDAEELKLCRDLLKDLAHDTSPEVVLPKILEMLTETATFRLTLLRLIGAALLELH